MRKLLASVATTEFTAPLSTCKVTQVSGLSGSDANGHPGVPAGSNVNVTVACYDNHDE